VAIPWPPLPAVPPGSGLGADLVHLTLALPTARDVWDGSATKWDTATWDAVDFNNFVDASCDCAGVSMERGRQDPLGHVQPARASFSLDDPTGIYSPWNTIDKNGRDLGAPVFGPDLPVRVATGTGPVFTGFVATVAEVDSGGESTVSVTCTDALSYLGDANGLEQPAAGLNEKAGARLGRIMDTAQVPALVDRQLAAGVIPLQATTLAKGALEEAWLTADSDGGSLWCTSAGAVRYADPNTLNTAEFSEPVAHFVDENNEVPGETVCPISFTITSSRANVKNVVSVACTGGTAQTVRDAASITRHGQRSTQRLDLIHQGDAWSLTIARMMLDRLAGAELTISPVDGVPTDDDLWWQLAHTLDIGSRVELTRTRWGQQLHVLATVDAINHQITLDQWTMTIRCSPGDQTQGFTRWDTAKWDSSYWDRRP
jgi:hypothetical protein